MFKIPKLTAMSLPVTIIIAEDCDYLREAYENLIQKQPHLKLLASVDNGSDLVETARELKPDIIITDIKMPRMDGIEACRRLEASDPQIRKISITMYDEIFLAREMLKAGARGFLLKNSPKAEILNCIEMVHTKGLYYKAGAGYLVNKKMKEEDEPTEYELEVLRRLCKGQQTKAIAAETFKSEAAVSLARGELKRKSTAQNDFEIALWAVQNGYVMLGEL